MIWIKPAWPTDAFVFLLRTHPQRILQTARPSNTAAAGMGPAVHGQTFSVHFQVTAKIARWKALYLELNNVRSRLRDGAADAGASTSQLMFELRRLQRESEKATAAVGGKMAPR